MNPELEVKVDERLLPEGKPRTAIFDPELKRLRAVQMMQARVAGNSIKRVAEMFQVSETTVERTLTYARRAGIMVEHADTILERMVPLAETAIIDVLKDPEIDKLAKANVALKIYEGTGLLGNKGKPNGAHGGDGELEKAMRELRQKAEADALTLEGQVADRSPKLLPSGGDADGSAEGLQLPPALSPGPLEGRPSDSPQPPAAPPAEDGRSDAEGRADEPVFAREPGGEG
jgi:hypothetical protein